MLLNFVAIAPLVAQQLYAITGTVKTPGGQPIWLARVSIDPGTYGDFCDSVGTGEYRVNYVYYIPPGGGGDKYLRIAKEGWVFQPSSFFIARNVSGNLVRNFIGVPAVTSGQTVPGAVGPNAWTYFGTAVPASATALEINYDGAVDAGLAASRDTWPTTPPQPGRAPLVAGVGRTLTISTTTTPAISAGTWFIGVYGQQATTFTLTARLSSALPAPTISGLALDVNGGPAPGVAVLTNNGATTAPTDGAGAFAVQTPYYWSGTITLHAPLRYFTPATRRYSALGAAVTGQDFQEFAMDEDVVAHYLIGMRSFIADELAAADSNGDGVVDIADVITFLRMAAH